MKIFKKSVWCMLTVYLAIWMVILIVGGIIMDGYRNTINNALNLTGYRTETLETDGEDTTRTAAACLFPRGTRSACSAVPPSITSIPGKVPPRRTPAALPTCRRR